MLLIHFRSFHWADWNAAVLCRGVEAWCVCIFIAGKWILLYKGVEETVPSYWGRKASGKYSGRKAVCIIKQWKHLGTFILFQDTVSCLMLEWLIWSLSWFICCFKKQPCLVNWLQQQNTASKALSINIPQAIPGTVLILIQNTNKLLFAWAIRAIKQSNNTFYLLPINVHL